MAYEYERDEWRSAIRSMTEVQRVIAETEGKITAGSKYDDMYEGLPYEASGDGDGDEAA